MAVKCEACGNSYHGNYKVCPKCQAVNPHREVVQGENVPVTVQPMSPLGVAGAPPGDEAGTETGDGAAVTGTEGAVDGTGGASSGTDEESLLEPVGGLESDEVYAATIRNLIHDLGVETQEEVLLSRQRRVKELQLQVAEKKASIQLTREDLSEGDRLLAEFESGAAFEHLKTTLVTNPTRERALVSREGALRADKSATVTHRGEGESNAPLHVNKDGRAQVGPSGRALSADMEENFQLFLAFQEQMRWDDATGKGE